jgi:hypothetical protein
LIYNLGKQDTAKSKIYVQLTGWPRINFVEDSFLTLVKRPALAYRSRLIFDTNVSDLAKIEIQRGDEKFALEQAKDVWRLASPVQVEADAAKTSQVAGDLARLEAVEYVSDDPKPADLDATYGLAKPALEATVTYLKDKPAQKLLIGKKRPDKEEYFAKLESAPAVFAVSKTVRDAVDQGSLAYRRLQLWQVPVDDLAELRFQKQGGVCRVKKEGSTWKIVEPFETSTATDQVQPLVNDLAVVNADRYEAHNTKDLAKYGLDKPHVTLTVTPAANKEGEPAKQQVLLVGKPTAEGAKTRYAKLKDADGIVVLGDKVATAVERDALDLLNRNLVSLDTKAITQVKDVIQENGGSETLTFHRDKDSWQVPTPTARFTADQDAMAEFLKPWANLKADRFAGYGPKIDPAAFGLDKPSRTITVTLKPAEGADKKPQEEHTLILGKAVPDNPMACYARLDNGPGVVVLAPAVTSELSRTSLDFVDRTVLKLDGAVSSVARRMGNQDLEVAKQGDAWQLVKPAALKADSQVMNELAGALGSLKAKRVAAYPAKDLKAFELDPPAATITIRLTGADGKMTSHVLRIGKAADPAKYAAGDRYAMAEGSQTVAVLPAKLADQLLGSPLQFRDRTIARFTDADRMQLQRGPRQAVFSKISGTWKLTSPMEAEAEHSKLEALVNDLAHLRADQLVAEKPADLKPFGLDAPQAKLTFQAGGADVLSLLIGGKEKIKVAGQEKEGDRSYAKLASGDLVFLLDPKLSAKVLAEYRSRSIWPTSLDAAQVETVRFGYASNPFTLEKRDTVWHVAGKPEFKVKSTAVTDTLDALARLKAERYVVDKDADWKLYGLEPPYLVIEIQSPTGKRFLHIGATEGSSKRRYARVLEGNRSDVFTVSEADAVKIVRELTAFSDKGAS